MPLACEVRRPQVLPPRGSLLDTSLVFYAPLWHPDLAISPFLTKNPGTQLSCTVTGAVWTPQGRWFDFINDKIQLPGGIFASNNFTITAWIKTANSGAHQWVLNCRNNFYIFLDVDSATGKAWFYGEIGGVGKDVYSNVAVNDGAFHSIICFKSSTVGMSMMVDGVIQADVDATATGNIDVTAAANGNLIGIYDAGTNPFGGTIGEILYNTRVLTTAQGRDNCLRTKWRYN